MDSGFSGRLALAIGIALPVAETVRLVMGGRVAGGLDHYLMGAFLLYGAYRARRQDAPGQRYLVAAWAFTCGVGYMNLVRRLEGMGEGGVEGGIVWVMAAGWLLCLLGLAASLRADAPAGG